MHHEGILRKMQTRIDGGQVEYGLPLDKFVLPDTGDNTNAVAYGDLYPAAADDLLAAINPDSLTVVPAALVEPVLADDPIGARVQFERLGYFSVDPDSAPGRPVFNRTVTLKDEWAKLQQKGKAK